MWRESEGENIMLYPTLCKSILGVRFVFSPSSALSVSPVCNKPFGLKKNLISRTFSMFFFSPNSFYLKNNFYIITPPPIVLTINLNRLLEIQ